MIRERIIFRNYFAQYHITQISNKYMKFKKVFLTSMKHVYFYNNTHMKDKWKHRMDCFQRFLYLESDISAFLKNILNTGNFLVRRKYKIFKYFSLFPVFFYFFYSTGDI